MDENDVAVETGNRDMNDTNIVSNDDREKED